jgi:uncharacterized membrane protein
MTEFLLRFLIAGGVVGVLDALWLMFVANKFYKSQIGNLLLDKPNMIPAIIFYVIYVVGVVAFVIAPALEKGSLVHAVGYGALFGLVAYATYDLTNLSTLKGFTSKVVIVDLLWGAFITAAVAGIAYLILHKS